MFYTYLEIILFKDYLLEKDKDTSNSETNSKQQHLQNAIVFCQTLAGLMKAKGIAG